MKIQAVRRQTLFNDLKLPHIIPKDFEKTFKAVELKDHRGDPIMVADVIVVKSPDPRHKLHRVFVACCLCLKKIPFGRIHQHFSIHMGTNTLMYSNTESSVVSFRIKFDSIQVRFKNSPVYHYSTPTISEGELETMKALAIAGRGLNSYINRVIKKRYTKTSGDYE